MTMQECSPPPIPTPPGDWSECDLSPLGRWGLYYAVELGWPVFPLEPGGKRPHPQLPAGGFHHATTDAAVIGNWWTRWPDANLGLYPARADLLVLDLDGAEAETFASSLGVDPHGTLSVRTGRDGTGWHCYYRSPDAPRIGNRSHGGVDVRAGAGYVVLPPSLHPSGRRYTWAGGFDFDRIALVPSLALTYCLEGPALTRTAPLRPRPIAPTLTRDVVRRARRYLEKVPTGLSDGRKQAAYRLAAALMADVGISAGDTAALVQAWNCANVPPLEDAALAAIITNAQKYARHGRAA